MYAGVASFVEEILKESDPSFFLQTVTMVESRYFQHQGVYVPRAPLFCNALTRQPLELESCSNSLRIQQVF